MARATPPGGKHRERCPARFRGEFHIGLNVDTSAATYKAHYEDDEGNEEQDFSQVCCAACETAKAEYGCDQGYNEKGDGPS